jgi:uncharacterized membrane protein
MLFAAVFLFVFIRVYKKESIKVSRKIFFQLAGIGCAMALHWYCFFIPLKYPMFL